MSENIFSLHDKLRESLLLHLLSLMAIEWMRIDLIMDIIMGIMVNIMVTMLHTEDMSAVRSESGNGIMEHTVLNGGAQNLM